jgi:hypothetical protein
MKYLNTIKGNSDLPYSEMQRQYLWLIFYRQQEYNRQNRKYSSSLAELGIDPTVEINGKVNSLSIESTSAQFTATVSDSINKTIRINNEGMVRISE